MTASSVSLTWNASTDNVAVTGYGVYRAGVRIDSSARARTTSPGSRVERRTRSASMQSMLPGTVQRGRHERDHERVSVQRSSGAFRAPGWPSPHVTDAVGSRGMRPATASVVAGYRLLRNGSGVATAATPVTPSAGSRAEPPTHSPSRRTTGGQLVGRRQQVDVDGRLLRWASAASAAATAASDTAASSWHDHVAPGGNLNAAYSQAKDGTTIQLAAGDYGVWRRPVARSW